MSSVVACSCGKKLRLPEGAKAKAVRCPACQQVVRLDGATTAGRPATNRPAPPAPSASGPVPPPGGAVATSAAPVPAAPQASPGEGRLVQDAPDVWLYVTDPDLIAQASESDGRRKTSLRTFGPGEEPLAELNKRDAEDIRDYLGKGEYVAWIGRPSNKHAGDRRLYAYFAGAVFAALGLGILLVGLLAPMPVIALKIVLPIFGLLMGGLGVAMIVLVARGAEVMYAGGARSRRGVYLLTNRRAIVWINKSTVRGFTGQMVMNMRRDVELDQEDEDFGNLLFTHGMGGNEAGPGFCDIEKVSEVEELVRGYLLDRVLEKTAAGDGPRLVPAEGPNPFAKGEGKKEAKGPPKKLELWRAAALAMEAEQALTPEMIAAAREHTEGVLDGSKLSDDEAGRVRDELQPGETIVWTGKPEPALVRGMARLVMIGLLGFAAFIVIVLVGVSFTVTPEGSGAVGMHRMALGIFGAVAVAFAVGGLGYPTYAVWRAARTCYVLTSRRALVWAADRMGKPALGEYGPHDLSNMHVVGNDVVFRTMTTVYKSKNSGSHATTRHFGFTSIGDAPAVERLVRETLVDPFLEKAYE